MDARQSVLIAAMAGLAAAAGGSLAFGRGPATEAEALVARVGGAPPRPAKVSASGQFVALTNAPPLFPVLSGPGALAELALRLEGVARSPGRVAALVSVGGAPSMWMELGESRDGVTLEDVGGSSATLVTARGAKVVRLGEGAAPSSPAPLPSGPDVAPPGLRAPEPASAPGAPP